jgi:hypothetical protein
VGFTEGAAIWVWAALRETLDGETTSSRFSMGLWDDFRGGGLNARCDDPLFFFSFPLTPARTVELEDDEVDNSLTTANP